MQINLSVDLYDSLSSCARYVRYEGAMTAIGIEIVNLMMLVRLVLYVLPPQPLVAYFSLSECTPCIVTKLD